MHIPKVNLLTNIKDVRPQKTKVQSRIIEQELKQVQKLVSHLRMQRGIRERELGTNMHIEKVNLLTQKMSPKNQSSKYNRTRLETRK